MSVTNSRSQSSSSGPLRRHDRQSQETLPKRLSSYAVAAGAAVSVMAISQGASARVIYTPAHESLTSIGFLSVDINNDGTSDFLLENEIVLGDGSYSRNVIVEGSGGQNTGVIDEQHRAFAVALQPGSRIGSGAYFSIVGFLLDRIRFFYGGGMTTAGEWKNVTARYVGVRFSIKGETHYGWIRLTVQNINDKKIDIGTLVTGYAYETTPDKAINAGQTKDTEQSDVGTDSVKPAAPTALKETDPGSLGALALGAQGLRLWRVNQVH